MLANLENWVYHRLKVKLKMVKLFRVVLQTEREYSLLDKATNNFIKNKKFNGSISIIIAADEETTGLGTPAVMKYLKRKREKIDFAIVGEPSSNKSIGDEIRIGRRGSMNGIITVNGKSGHAHFLDLHKSMHNLSKNNIKIKKFTFR